MSKERSLKLHKQYIIKRDGSHVPISYDAITARNEELASSSPSEGRLEELDIDIDRVTKKVVEGLKNGMTTSELDELSCETANHMSIFNPDYEKLATRIGVSNLHKDTPATFKECIDILKKGYIQSKSSLTNISAGSRVILSNNSPHGLQVINEEIYQFALKNITEIEKSFDHKLDYNLTYFGFKTLRDGGYLKKVVDISNSTQKVIEKPQFMLMMIALQLYGPKTYHESQFENIETLLIDAGYTKKLKDSIDKDIVNNTPVKRRPKDFYESRRLYGVSLTNWRHNTEYNTVYEKDAVEWEKDSKEPSKFVFTPNSIIPRDTPGDIQKVLSRFKEMQTKTYTHASPTMFYSSTIKPQLSSCFLLNMGDSIKSIGGTNLKNMEISQHAGGIGNSITKIRAKGSLIKGTQGKSDGIVPMIRMVNETANYVNQGSRRKGAFALYIEPWHAEIFQFLDLKKNTGVDAHRARDLFYALWIPDIFMTRVEQDGQWSLFCPNDFPNLAELYGEKFDIEYVKAEKSGLVKKTIKARELYQAILEIQEETGTPYMISKDASNLKSNHKNIGTIYGSNLCAEIIQFHDPNSTGTCNLASISLPDHVKDVLDLKDKKVLLDEPDQKDVKFDIGKMRELTGGDTFTRRFDKKLMLDESGKDEKIDVGKMKELTGSDTLYTKNKDEKDINPLKFWCNDSKVDPILNNIAYVPVNSLNAYRDLFYPGTYGTRFTFSCQYCDNIKVYAGIPRCCDKCNTANLKDVPKDVKLNFNFRPWSELVIASTITEMKLKSKVTTNSFDEPLTRCFDFEKLAKTCLSLPENMNNVIDKTFYPIDSAMINNLLYRPIGIGTQGISDVLHELKLTWEPEVEESKHKSEIWKSKQLIKEISEVKYYFGMLKSCELAQSIDEENKKLGDPYWKFSGSYSAFIKSPISKGILQPDMWPEYKFTDIISKEKWNELREKCKHGVRNSLLFCQMPTASSSQILGNTEGDEALNSLMYTRNSNVGTFPITSKHMYSDIKKLGLWNKKFAEHIMMNNGSIQQFNRKRDNIPMGCRDISGRTSVNVNSEAIAAKDHDKEMLGSDEVVNNLKKIYKTVWELSQKRLCDIHTEIAALTCQSRSDNVFFKKATISILSSYHMYAWKKGKKTWSYYIRSQEGADTIKFTISKNTEKDEKIKSIELLNGEDCTNCSA